MCFYDQYQFECGDIKFGYFRRRCKRVHPPGTSCGSKTANEVFHLQKKCSLCDKIATNRYGQQQEWDRIDGLESKDQVDDIAVQHSIGIINQLQNEILTLELERRERRFTVPDDDLEKNGNANPGTAVEKANLVATRIARKQNKSSPSPPPDKLTKDIEGDPCPQKAPPSATRVNNVPQLGNGEAHSLSLIDHKRLKNIEISLAETSGGNLTKNTRDILEHWFKEHLKYPYPSVHDKKQLCSRTGLSATQVRMKYSSH